MRVANNSLTISIIVDRFVEHYKDTNTLTKRQIKQVIYLYNKLLSYWIINKGYTFKLPHRLGSLSINKGQMGYCKLYFDYEQWNKNKVKVYHTNDHSDGWYASIYWDKKTCKVPNQSYYKFELTRGNNREIAKIMKKQGGHQIYKSWN